MTTEAKPRRVVIIFYTDQPKPMEEFFLRAEGLQEFIERIVALAKQKAKFAVYEIGECVGDFS